MKDFVLLQSSHKDQSCPLYCEVYIWMCDHSRQKETGIVVYRHACFHYGDCIEKSYTVNVAIQQHLPSISFAIYWSDI